MALAKQEMQRLRYLETHQKEIRAELYKHLADAVDALYADIITVSGVLRTATRKCVADVPTETLHAAAFETTLSHIAAAARRRAVDEAQSLSAQVVLNGRGTHAFACVGDVTPRAVDAALSASDDDFDDDGDSDECYYASI